MDKASIRGEVLEGWVKATVGASSESRAAIRIVNKLRGDCGLLDTAGGKINGENAKTYDVSASGSDCQQALLGFSKASEDLDDLLNHLSDNWIWYDSDGAIGAQWTAGGQKPGQKEYRDNMTRPKDLLDSFDAFLDDYWEGITKLTNALDKPDVKSNAGPGFVKGLEGNKKFFEPVGKRGHRAVGKDCSSDKLVKWVIKTNKMLRQR
ncbi:hypothetical protein LTR56_017524 [Elasticomyces elasticus]|nr:hypothetical protein LTR56_017524 [Elasticomyces elasticus]KAK3665076.1 hypothetical protein LTR22_004132 [Elasticomyces elasticus]KAK4931550.1 hypothetical protein LTR49_001938 [Elasticomyces elasticus]KAK5766710.1 hypothetical protein LTS12_003059 [Elasticomyces elasticus]